MEYRETFMSLTKSDIVERVSKEIGASKKQAAGLVELLFKTFKKKMAVGEQMQITGFGNFFMKDRPKRIGRNPKNGTLIEIAAKRVLTFKACNILKDDIMSRCVHRLGDDGVENTSIPLKDGTRKALTFFINNIKTN